MLDLSIIIIGYKTRGLLKNCLKSILNDLNGSFLNYKILVLDNNSDDGTKEMMQESFPQIETIISDKNLGYAKAVNLGIKKEQSKYYFILNPDTIFSQGKIIEKLYQFMENNPQTGLAGPKLINPDGSVQYSCSKFPPLFIPLLRRTSLSKISAIKKIINQFLMTGWNHNQTADVDWVIGTGMFVRDKAIEQVGLMDERFFMYFEDADWCRRFWRTGWQIKYLAEIEVIHYHGRPSLKSGGLRDFIFNPNTRVHFYSWWKYFWKYRFKERD